MTASLASAALTAGRSGRPMTTVTGYGSRSGSFQKNLPPV